MAGPRRTGARTEARRDRPQARGVPGGGDFGAFDVARRGARLTGICDAASLSRVADRLSAEGGDAMVGWSIAGTVDASGRPALEVSLGGSVPLVCQRCLQPFSWPVSQHTLLLLAKDERELALLDDNDEHEVVLADAPLDPSTLIEDELLLTLPFSPRCPRAECSDAAPSAGQGMHSRTSAFAALAALKSDSAKKP